MDLGQLPQQDYGHRSRLISPRIFLTGGLSMQSIPTCAVLIPVYRETPDAMERALLSHCLQVFSRRPCLIVHPQGMHLARYEELTRGTACRYVALPSSHFTSPITYNEMLLEPSFYRTFMGYEYILMHQLDSWVFADRLDEFLSLNVDYIGCAPPREQAKQDGGLSLRRTVACMEACKRAHTLDGISLLLRKRYMGLGDLWAIIRRHLALPIDKRRPYRSEDSFFTFAAAICVDGFRVATTEQAMRFGFCENPAWLYRQTGALPMGCHAPYGNGHADFWHLHIGIRE